MKRAAAGVGPLISRTLQRDLSPSEALPDRALIRARHLRTWRDRLATCESAIAALEAEQAEQVETETRRLGRPVPSDALILDLLTRIEVKPDDVWLWLGNVNGHGTPRFRYRHGDQWGTPGYETTVVRGLAIGFGLIPPDFPGILYPRARTPGAALDVNPWHRTIGSAGRGAPPWAARNHRGKDQ